MNRAFEDATQTRLGKRAAKRWAAAQHPRQIAEPRNRTRTRRKCVRFDGSSASNLRICSRRFRCASFASTEPRRRLAVFLRIESLLQHSNDREILRPSRRALALDDVAKRCDENRMTIEHHG